MIKFLKSIFSSSRKKQIPEVAAIEYEGFNILPTPKKVNGGWSTEATISKEIDGVIQSHHFIRADTTSSQDGAIELTISKAKVMIDQVGDQMFSR